MGLGESKEESATAGSSNSVDGPMVLLHVYNLSPEYNRFAGTVGMVNEYIFQKITTNKKKTLTLKYTGSVSHRCGNFRT
jgi:hypothetical protein